MLDSLVHDYFILRHGLSIPNELKIIVSSLENGTDIKYGLSEKGKEQVAQRAPEISDFIIQNRKKASNNNNNNKNILIISSPFSRARETAQIVANSLFPLEQKEEEEQEEKQEKQHVQVDSRLRERDFGSLELKSDSNYKLVWEEDLQKEEEEQQMTKSSFGAESLNSVWSRVESLVSECEKNKELPNGCAIVFVSHGDTLQITQTAFARRDLKEHRSLPHLSQAEVRLISS